MSQHNAYRIIEDKIAITAKEGDKKCEFLIDFQDFEAVFPHFWEIGGLGPVAKIKPVNANIGKILLNSPTYIFKDGNKLNCSRANLQPFSLAPHSTKKIVPEPQTVVHNIPQAKVQANKYTVKNNVAIVEMENGHGKFQLDADVWEKIKCFYYWYNAHLGIICRKVKRVVDGKNVHRQVSISTDILGAFKPIYYKDGNKRNLCKSNIGFRGDVVEISKVKEQPVKEVVVNKEVTINKVSPTRNAFKILEDKVEIYANNKTFWVSRSDFAMVYNHLWRFDREQPYTRINAKNVTIKAFLGITGSLIFKNGLKFDFRRENLNLAKVETRTEYKGTEIPNMFVENMDESVTINLNDGRCAVVDKEDWFRIKQFQWLYMLRSGQLYHTIFRRDERNSFITLAEEVMNVRKKEIKHIDSNRFNCRKKNLFVVENKI